ncbi:uncharacterized protein [Euwallacea fornicatus]|uniref:uncharacterized protein n=1 Tax=Euwallacea fornicatus TaxID=995702 RepID=UPI00338E2FF1
MQKHLLTFSTVTTEVFMETISFNDRYNVKLQTLTTTYKKLLPMEDSKSLVTVFLQNIFRNRQHIIDTTFKLIYDYNTGDRLTTDYEKTLKGISTLLGKEIPNQVLVYLFTLVDMPLDLIEPDDIQLKPVIEKMNPLEGIQETQNCLTDNSKPLLNDCTGTSRFEEIPNTQPQETKPKTGRCKKSDVKKCDRSRTGKVSSLLDLVAITVVNNHSKLKKTYQKKFDRAWKMVNSNTCKGAQLEQCYETLRDLNKKRKLLRDIENDNITEEVVADLYHDVDIFLKEKHVYEAVNMDFFECASQWSMTVILNEFS